MSIAVFVHDSAVRLIISLTDGGIPYHIESGGRAVFYGKRPDDTPLCHNCMIDDTGRIIYDFNDQTASVEGITDCQIRIYGRSRELVSAPRFIIVADERPVNDADIEKQEDSPLAALDEIQFAEIERVDAETARAEAEKARADAEAERITNEQARIDAEAVRIKNENERIDAEAERIKNEEARIEAETAQNQKISELEGNITDNERRLNEIEEHLAPKYIITDDKTAYRKDVPANACSKVQLNSIGGMTYIDETTNTFVDAKVTEIKGIGANKLGGKALRDAIFNSIPGATEDEDNKTVTFKSTNASMFRFENVKPYTQYTIILYGHNTKSTSNVTNIRISYTDGTNSDLKFETMGADSYSKITTNANKSVKAIIGVNGSEYTVLYYDKCGIFEGNISLDEFQPYEENPIFQIPPEIQALPNYGKMFTELDLVNKKYYDYYVEDEYYYWIDSVEKTTNSDGSYTYTCEFSTNAAGDIDIIGMIVTEKPYTSVSIKSNMSFVLTGSSSVDLTEADDNSIVNELFGRITFILKMIDVYYHYTQQQTIYDISSYIDNNIIKVTAGGAIEFVNDGKKAVPSSVSYMMGGHLLENEV
jgi:hypothetical protein